MKENLFFVGVLHQAFGDYANSLNKLARDEWMKVQGRFVDITVRTTLDEQIHMLSQSINSEHQTKNPSKSSQVIAEAVGKFELRNTDDLAMSLERCWPLHPVVACLLGPLSQSRFGQKPEKYIQFF